MAKEDLLDLDGIVTKVIPGGKFEVEVKDNKGEVITVMAHVGGKLMRNKIKIVLGDKVQVSVSPYYIKNGVITWRYK